MARLQQENVEEYLQNLPPQTEVELEDILGRGHAGRVYSTNLEGIAAKILFRKASFPKEHSGYKLAAELGLGPAYHGWCIYNGKYGILMEKLPGRFTPTNPRYITRLTNLIKRIAETGYFCGDFHTNNIMVDSRGGLRLIDPSLVNTEEFLQRQIASGRLGEEFADLFGTQKIVDFGMGLMVDYITHPSFGGIPLESHPKYTDAFGRLLGGKKVLRFLFTNGGWEYDFWKPSFPPQNG